MTSTPSDKESAPRITGAGVAAFVGIVLATVVAAAYLFEYQYLSVFGIPGQLARVGAEQLAFAIAGLIVVVAVLALLAAAGAAISDSLKGDYGLMPHFAVLAVFGSALALMYFGAIPHVTEAVLLLLAFYAVGAFGLPLLDMKSRRSWRRYCLRLRAIERLEARKSSKEPKTEITAATSLAAGLALFFLPIAYLAGQASAITQETFLTCDQPKRQLVLRLYGDVMIGLDFDEKTKALGSEAIVRKLSATDCQTMRTARLGPLAGLPVRTEQKQ